MSLLQNEDFAIYQLRTGYLAQIHDGVGERLINLNTSFLNDPAFRAGGWSTNPPELKRTHSPPIPTAGASEYFKPPPPAPGARGASLDDDDEEEGGLVTGRGSTDTVGPALVSRRRRRREPVDEDDSSDLSDESNEETEGTHRPGNAIRFSKMPERERSGSSPLRGAFEQEGPEVMVTSPSRPPDKSRLRAGSLGAVETVKARARRDTATSSELSSEGDLDPSLFRRQQIRPKHTRPNVSDIHEQDGESNEDEDENDENEDGDDGDGLSAKDEASHTDSDSLDSDFSEDVAGSSLLDRGPLDSSSPFAPMAKPVIPQSPSPRKAKPIVAPIPMALPGPRPISQIQPVSALSQAIKAKSKKSQSPLERFTAFAGSGVANPLYIKICPPGDDGLGKPVEVVIRRQLDDGTAVSVADAIGFSLWRWTEEQGALARSMMSSNQWTLRIIDDDEVDFDFPALTRTRPIADFTSNNNRGARGRSREKPWDEFALVAATEAQARENERLTPQFSEDLTEEPAEDASPLPSPFPPPPPSQAPNTPGASTPTPDPVKATQALPRRNPITDHRSALAAFRKDSSSALDVPEASTSHASPRVGAPRTLTIHFTDAAYAPHTLTLAVTTDTYLSEIFASACAQLALDKAAYVLRVTGTSTLAPADRTVEALGPLHSNLDLVRRRFVGESYAGATAGSLGSSSSPNAPLLLTAAAPGTPSASGGARSRANPFGKRSGVGERSMLAHPLAQQTDLFGIGGGSGTYKRYAVVRKQPMSFTPSNPRTLALEGEYMHIMPPDLADAPGAKAPLRRGRTGALAGRDDEVGSQGKTTTIHFSNVVGCKVNHKHPKTFRLYVFRERETKRYDFEARGVDEAGEIVAEIKAGMERFKDNL